jgi:AcrR family transcriptional regulator
MTMTVPQPRRPRSGRAKVRSSHGEHRRRLLGVAKHLFGTVGYGRTTLEDVARSAKVTPSVLARHFADKAALLRALLAEVRAATIERWQPLLDEHGDPVDRLRAVVVALLTAVRDLGPEFRFLNRTLAEEADAEALPLLRTYFDDCAAFLAALLEEGRRIGLVRRAPEAPIAAWRILRTALGDALVGPLLTEPEPPERAADGLLNGLLKTDV